MEKVTKPRPTELLFTKKKTKSLDPKYAEEECVTTMTMKPCAMACKYLCFISLFFLLLLQKGKEKKRRVRIHVRSFRCAYYISVPFWQSLSKSSSLSLSLLKKRCLYDVIIVNVKRRLSSARSPFDPSSNNERCVFLSTHRSSQHSPSGAPRAIKHANERRKS